MLIGIFWCKLQKSQKRHKLLASQKYVIALTRYAAKPHIYRHSAFMCANQVHVMGFLFRENLFICNMSCIFCANGGFANQCDVPFFFFHLILHHLQLHPLMLKFKFLMQMAVIKVVRRQIKNYRKIYLTTRDPTSNGLLAFFFWRFFVSSSFYHMSLPLFLWDGVSVSIAGRECINRK